MIKVKDVTKAQLNGMVKPTREELNIADNYRIKAVQMYRLRCGTRAKDTKDLFDRIFRRQIVTRGD